VIKVELFNPINEANRQFDVLGTGTVWRTQGSEYDIDNNRMICHDEKGMGIWAVGGAFYRVRSAEGDNPRELNKQVKEGLVTSLEREFKETDRPQPGEATDTFGTCPDCTMGITQVRTR
jgi:hypothetical protein